MGDRCVCVEVKVAEPRKDRDWLIAQSTLLRALTALEEQRECTLAFRCRGVDYLCTVTRTGFRVVPKVRG